MFEHARGETLPAPDRLKEPARKCHVEYPEMPPHVSAVARQTQPLPGAFASARVPEIVTWLQNGVSEIVTFNSHPTSKK